MSKGHGAIQRHALVRLLELATDEDQLFDALVSNPNNDVTSTQFGEAARAFTQGICPWVSISSLAVDGSRSARTSMRRALDKLEREGLVETALRHKTLVGANTFVFHARLTDEGADRAARIRGHGVGV